VPYPPDYGGVIDIYYKIRSLKELGVEIILHCFQYGRQRSQELEQLCKKVYYYQRYSGIRYFFNTLPYIVVTRSSPDLIRNLINDSYPILFEGIHTCFFINNSDLKSRKKILRTHNIEHEYYRGLYEAESSPFRKIFFLAESGKLKKYARQLSDDIFIEAISQADTEYFRRIFPNSFHLPPFHPYDKPSCLTGNGEYILIHGDLSVPANIHSTIYLFEKILYDMPFQVIIAGKNPGQKIRKLATRKSHTGIRANPDEHEMHELIRQAQINLIHSFQPAGIKLKLLTALFNGRHCIANSEAVRNSGLESLCHIGQDPGKIKELVHQLMEIPFTEEESQKREMVLKKDYSNISNAQKIYDMI
jgi:hypothetical protein